MSVAVRTLIELGINTEFLAAAVSARALLEDAAALAGVNAFAYFGQVDERQNVLTVEGWLGEPDSTSRGPMIAPWKGGELVMLSPGLPREVPIPGPILLADDVSRGTGWQGAVVYLNEGDKFLGWIAAISKLAQEHDRVLASLGLYAMCNKGFDLEGVHFVYGDRAAYEAARSNQTEVNSDADMFSYITKVSSAGDIDYFVDHHFEAGFDGVGCVWKVTVAPGELSDAVKFLSKAVGATVQVNVSVGANTLLVKGGRESDGYSHIGFVVVERPKD